jgi:hypothetical protein
MKQEVQQLVTLDIAAAFFLYARSLLSKLAFDFTELFVKTRLSL